MAAPTIHELADRLVQLPGVRELDVTPWGDGGWRLAGVRDDGVQMIIDDPCDTSQQGYAALYCADPADPAHERLGCHDDDRSGGYCTGFAGRSWHPDEGWPEMPDLDDLADCWVDPVQVGSCRLVGKAVDVWEPWVDHVLGCPRCGGPIPNRRHHGEYSGAVSRTDNRTELCSECGEAEGLEAFAGCLVPREAWTPAWTD